MKGYAAALEAVVGLPEEVISVSAQIILIIPDEGTFSAAGTMERRPGGIWRMKFRLGGGIGEP
jgi:hypothetical protein